MPYLLLQNKGLNKRLRLGYDLCWIRLGVMAAVRNGRGNFDGWRRSFLELALQDWRHRLFNLDLLGWGLGFFLGLYCWARWWAVTSKAIFKELCQLWIRLLPLIQTVNLQGTKVYTWPDRYRHFPRCLLLNQWRIHAGLATLSPGFLQVQLIHNLLLDSFFVIEVKYGAHAGSRGEAVLLCLILLKMVDT